MKEQNDIVQEVNNIAPTLGGMKPFLTVPEAPEGYFEQQLTMAVWSKIDSSESISFAEEIEQLSPLLAEIKQHAAGVSAPDGYFEGLSTPFIIHRNEPIVARPNILRLFAGVAAAASILLVVSLAVKFSARPGEVYTAPTEYSMADLTVEEIINYLSEDPEDLDVRLIAQELNIQAPTEQTIQITSDDLPAVNAYLEEHIDALDESMIAEELL